MKPSVKNHIKLVPGCFSNNPAYSPAIPSHQTNKSLPKNFCQEQLRDLDDEGLEFWFSAEEAAAHETFRKSLEDGVRNDTQDEGNDKGEEDQDNGRDYYENQTTEDKKLNRQPQGNQIVSSANLTKSRGFYRTPDDKENKSPYLGNNTNKPQPLKKTTSAGTLNSKKQVNQYVSSSTASLVVQENHNKGYQTQSQLKQSNNCSSNKNINNMNQQKHSKEQFSSQTGINYGNRRFQQQEKQHKQQQSSQSQSRSHSKSPSTAGTPSAARVLTGNSKKSAIRSSNVINQGQLDIKQSPILRENNENFNADSFYIHNSNAYSNNNMHLHQQEPVTNLDDKFSAKIANDIIENILDKDELYERTRVENKRLKGRIHGLESQIKVLQQNQIQTKSAAALSAQNYQQEFTNLNEKLQKLKKLQTLYIEEKKLRETSQNIVQIQQKRFDILGNLLQICVQRFLVGHSNNNSSSSFKHTEIEQETVKKEIYLGLIELKEQGVAEYNANNVNDTHTHRWLEDCIFQLEKNSKNNTIITGNNIKNNREQIGLGANQDQLQILSKIQSSDSFLMKGNNQQLMMKVSVQDTLQEEDEEENEEESNMNLGNSSNNIARNNDRNKVNGDIGLSGQQASLRVERQLVFDSDLKSETQHQQSDYQNEIISDDVTIENKQIESLQQRENILEKRSNNRCIDKDRTENEGKTIIHLKAEQTLNINNHHSAFLDCNSTNNTTSTAILSNINNNNNNNIHSNKSQQLQSPQEEDYVIATFDYIAQKDKDLSMRKGDKIKVVKRTKNGWWIGMLNKNIGYFPSNYTQEINVARATNN